MPCEIEPCGCEESNALREILEGLVEYNEMCDPCNDPECECGFCVGGRLLAGLEKRRKEMRRDAAAFMRFITGEPATDEPQPKQGEFKWE